MTDIHVHIASDHKEGNFYMRYSHTTYQGECKICDVGELNASIIGRGTHLNSNPI